MTTPMRPFPPCGRQKRDAVSLHSCGSGRRLARSTQDDKELMLLGELRPASKLVPMLGDGSTEPSRQQALLGASVGPSRTGLQRGSHSANQVPPGP